MSYDGLEDVARFVCSKLKDPAVVNSGESSSYTWTVHLGCPTPSDAFMQQTLEMEAIFKNKHGDSIVISKKIIEDLLTNSAHINLSQKAKELFFKTRTYLRVKDLNKTVSLKPGKRKMIKTVT